MTKNFCRTTRYLYPATTFKKLLYSLPCRTAGMLAKRLLFAMCCTTFFLSKICAGLQIGLGEELLKNFTDHVSAKKCTLLVLIFAVIEMTVFRGYIFLRIRYRNAAKIPQIALKWQNFPKKHFSRVQIFANFVKNREVGEN